MDALTAVLDGPRARSAFLLRCAMSPPWAIRVQDQAPLCVVALVRGAAWVVLDDDTRHLLGPGQVALFRGPDPYVVADDPVTPIQAVIHPGQRCTTPGGDSVEASMRLGVRTWGNDAEGSTLMLIGTYEGDGEIGRRLLGALPPLAVLSPQDRPLSGLVTMLMDEVSRDEPGQQVVLDRLLDLLVIASVRSFFAQGGDGSRPGPSGREGAAWYVAHSDPVVGTALQRLHDDPAAPWTVGSLASVAGVSRAGLARRFAGLVGEPPMSYLTGWRLAMAADLLRDPETTVAAVAREVGYSSPFTFSTAFKRHYGMSPTAYRARRSSDLVRA